MKTKSETATALNTESLQLIDGEFTAAEAFTIILNLLEEKINFHKIRKLQIWEKDHTMDSKKINARIEALEAEKVKAQKLLNQYAQDKTRLKVDGSIKITTL